MLCREAPAVLRELGVDALLADQMEAAGGLLAEHLQLPYVSVACALPVNREPRLPLPVMPWGYADSPRGENLNRGSSQVYDLLMRPHARVIAEHAARFGLAPRQALHECLSPYAQISQTSAAFDFPRLQAPAHFHAVGPLRTAQAEAPLQIPLSARRPFVFASLGTLQGGRFGLFQRIARACAEQDVQLLLAHCGGLNTVQERVLERQGATWVTDFAPQRAALARADAVITHAGLNTVMDAFAAGVPMLAIPIAFDQPGVAARVLHAGAGLRLFPQLASRASLGRSLRQLLDEPRFAANAARVGAGLAQAGGVERAADIVEGVLQPLEHRADAS
jgi:zeaxanthin glucosyltransferase